MYVPLQVNRFQNSILLIVQYKYLKSCSRRFYPPNLILRTRSCGNGFITQSGWVFHFHQTTQVSWKCFVPQLYQFRRGISGRPALKYFYMIHRVGRVLFQGHLVLGYIKQGNLTERNRGFLCWVDSKPRTRRKRILLRLFFRCGPLPSGSWLGNHLTKKPPRPGEGGFFRSTPHREGVSYYQLSPVMKSRLGIRHPRKKESSV